MANIFISFYNVFHGSDRNTVPCFYEGMIQGLSSAGNNIKLFHHKRPCTDWGKIPSDILSQLKEFQPDLCILFNNDFYDISDFVECPIVIYEVDSPILYSNKQNIKNKPDRYCIFTSQISSVDILKKEYHIKDDNILVLPFFTSVHAEDIPQSINICFIGSNFIESKCYAPYNHFMMSEPSEAEIDVYKKIMHEIEINPFVTEEELISKFYITSHKVLKNINLFDNRFYISNNKRVATLSQIADLGLDLYGTKNWMYSLTSSPELVLNYKNRHVYSIKHNQDIYNTSKIGININHIQAISGFSWRVCDIMASNACLISDYSPDLMRLFPKAGIPTFRNRYEARDICKKILAENNMRKDIVAKCHEAIDKEYRFEHILMKMEDFLSIKFKNEASKENSVSHIDVNVSTQIVDIVSEISTFQKLYSHLKIKKRLKNFFYLGLLLVGQIPGIDIIINHKRRNDIYSKIKV